VKSSNKGEEAMNSIVILPPLATTLVWVAWLLWAESRINRDREQSESLWQQIRDELDGMERKP